MNDMEMLNWLQENISRLGIKPDWTIIKTDADGHETYSEFTDIREKIKRLAKGDSK